MSAAAAATQPSYSYSGVRKDGTPVMGSAPWSDLAAEVQRMFAGGWRHLRVTRGGPVPPPLGAQTVAEIGPHPENGRRSWWSE
jgi:hypothetical protein